jgi:hypothetical protein
MNRIIVAGILSVVLMVISTGDLDAQEVPATISSSSVSAFPDFLQVRAKYLSTVITAHPSRALVFQTVFVDSPAGKIRVSVEENNDSFFVLFLRERSGEYPYGSRGNVIIQRDVKTGFVTRVVWYLSDDGMSWISLTPKNERTLIDYVLAGSLARAAYSVSGLIYNFFTKPFSWTYDITKAGLDWSPVLGQPDPVSAAFAANLVSVLPSGSMAQLLKAASDFTIVGNYLASTGQAGQELEEISTFPFEKIAASSGDRSPGLLAVKPYLMPRGLSVDVIPGILVRGIADRSAFIAYFESTTGDLPLQTAIVPYTLPTGGYAFAAVNAANSRSVDIMAVIRSMPGSYVRLFRLPLPATP